MKTISVKRRLAHPPELVWAALTDGEQIEKWLMPNDFRPEIGHKFEFRSKPAPGFDGIVECEVIALEPQQRMVISWFGGGIDSTVTFSLTPLGTGTELLLVQEGFKISNIIPRLILGMGWKSIIGKKLPAVLDDMTLEAA